MKTTYKSILIAAITSTTIAANAEQIDVTSTDTTSFEIGGTVTALCKVSNYDGGTRSTTLDLTSSTAQTTASVSSWCNTGQATVSTTYTSLNGGKLKGTANGGEIPYLIDISGTSTDLNLASAQTVNQVTGSGISGDQATRSVKVKPQINGFETADTYRDTITVTVAPN